MDRVLLLIVVSVVCSHKSCGEGNELVLFFLIMDKGVDSSCCLFDWFLLQIALMDSLMMKWNILNLRACLHGWFAMAFYFHLDFISPSTQMVHFLSIQLLLFGGSKPFSSGECVFTSHAKWSVPVILASKTAFLKNERRLSLWEKMKITANVNMHNNEK